MTQMAAADATAAPHPTEAAAVGGSGGGSASQQNEQQQQCEDEFYELTLGGVQAPVLEYGSSEGHPSAAGLRRYLCLFLHRYLEFRLPEVEALAEAVASRGSASAAAYASSSSSSSRNPSSSSSANTSGSSSSSSSPTHPVVFEKPYGNYLPSPYWYAHLPSDEAAEEIASRSMLVKVFLEVWGEGDTLEDMLQAVADYPAELKAPYAGEDQSFKFAVECLGFKMEPAQQVALMERLEAPTQFKGPIVMSNPRHRFFILACGGDLDGLPDVPHRYYFGREVAASDRSVIKRYALPSRRYLGPTSMDTEMSFIMANLGQVRRGSLVYDPFVGTGSILLSCAHYGAHTLGTDIDMRVIKFGKKDGKGQRVNIWTNFSDQKLESPLGLVRCDLHRPPFRRDAQEWVDAVICDPPYGVRAGGRKSSSRDYSITDRQTHVASTDPYTLGECLRDLVSLAARVLVCGGRLVYFLPAAPGYYHESELPTHPAMKMVANSEQILTTRYSRRLITMQKVAHFDAAAEAAHYAALGPPRMSIDDLHEHVYAPAERGPDGSKLGPPQPVGPLGGPQKRIPSYRAKCI